jgi:hypothetical protein
MSFVVVMPTYFEWNVSEVLANLTWDTLYHPSLQERPTKVWLPKLHLQQQLDLVATLSQLGKELGDRVPLGGLGRVRELPVCLSQRWPCFLDGSI